MCEGGRRCGRKGGMCGRKVCVCVCEVKCVREVCEGG